MTGLRNPACAWIGDVFRSMSLSSCFIIAHIWGLGKHVFPLISNFQKFLEEMKIPQSHVLLMG